MWTKRTSFQWRGFHNSISTVQVWPSYRFSSLISDVNSTWLHCNSVTMCKPIISFTIYWLDKLMKSTDVKLGSNSGFTQDGCGVFSRILPPNLCNKAKTTEPPIRVIKACAVKHHVHPYLLCQDAIKNWYSWLAPLFQGNGVFLSYRIDECAQIEEDGIKGDHTHGL